MQGMAKLKILFHPISYIIMTISLKNYSIKYFLSALANTQKL